MKLGIMQPYFFPYLGYFDLINQTDRWVVFDEVQYIRHGWVNRNRILHPHSGWQYIVVPLKKHHRGDLIKDIRINQSIPWGKKIVSQLAHYKKHAPHYEEVIDFVEKCLSFKTDYISELNVFILEKICKHLEIPFKFQVFSEMKLNLPPVTNPGEWALHISAELDASEYLNPPGGKVIFEPEKFSSKGIKLTIQNFQNMTYDCNKYEFEPGLSIIDVMMWNDKSEIVNWLFSQSQKEN